jgi:histone deacetylase 1/2
MIAAGFKPSFIDSCVYTQMIDGTMCTVIVHVDDFKIMSTSIAALDFVEDIMRKAFKKITVKNEIKHDFLGMTFDYSEEGYVNITQSKYINEIIQIADVKRESENPAIPNLFYVNENSPTLVEHERKKLHTLVCKAQYLANRTRPDILPVAHFLSRRVNRLTEEDKEKMVKMAEYLFHSKQLGLRLGVIGDLRVTVYIDASYATHNDRKSQTGMCISFGCGAVYSSSKRQKINTKSACEAELVGLSDGLGIPIQLQNFLLTIGYKLPPILVMQDNTSTIFLATNGRSNSDATRHVDIRYFWMCDRIKRKQIELKHVVTLLMIADVLTKPVQGLLFVDLRSRLLGYD